MQRATPSKYEPLRRYLAAVPSETKAVTLSLAEIEGLLGSPLPASAWATTFWLGSPRLWVAAPQARAWLAAGWRVTSHALRAVPPVVTFERLPSR